MNTFKAPFMMSYDELMRNRASNIWQGIYNPAVPAGGYARGETYKQARSWATWLDNHRGSVFLPQYQLPYYPVEKKD